MSAAFANDQWFDTASHQPMRHTPRGLRLIPVRRHPDALGSHQGAPGDVPCLVAGGNSHASSHASEVADV